MAEQHRAHLRIGSRALVRGVLVTCDEKSHPEPPGDDIDDPSCAGGRYGS